MKAKSTVLTLADMVAALARKQPPKGFLKAAASVPIRSVVIDSREATPGCLFVALHGESRDGHDFVPQALAIGASAVIAERPQAGAMCVDMDQAEPLSPGASLTLPICLVVSNSLAALQRSAQYWREQQSVRVVGVTGSVGKTTCKESIAAVLRQRYETLKSEGNYNNEIGLPLTLLQLTRSHQYVVVEMGMYAVGEIAKLAEIAQPQVGVVTNVGPTHLERLGTLERIAQAKAELPRALPEAERGGIAILNADDERVAAMAEHTRAQVFTYGLGPSADLWVDEIESQGLEGTRFRFHRGSETICAQVPMLGRHSVQTAMSAAAVGLVEGMSWSEILAGLNDSSSQLRLMALSGPKGCTLLDDSYNSSPASSIAALNLLAELDGRKIVVMGDMLELGPYEQEGHRLVGRRARDVADLVVAVGPLGRTIGEEAREAGLPAEAVLFAASNAEAAKLVDGLARPGDVVLIKGSRGMKMEEIVVALSQATPERGVRAKQR